MLIHSVATAPYTCQSTSRNESISTQHSNHHADDRQRPHRACRHGATASGVDQKHRARAAHRRHLSLSHLQLARPLRPELAGIGQVSDIGLGADGDPGRGGVLRLVLSAVRFLRALHVLAPAYCQSRADGALPALRRRPIHRIAARGYAALLEIAPAAAARSKYPGSRREPAAWSCDDEDAAER